MYRIRFLLDEFQLYYDPTITSLLSHCDFTLRTYAEGYDFVKNNFSENPCYPHGYDSTDIPFNYYAAIIDNINFIKDYLEFQNDIKSKNLPEVSYIKPLGTNTGHPVIGDISSELKFLKETVDMILESEYRDDTLILYLPNESCGYYDHVPPPRTNIVDDKPYGARIPFIAFGKFAKKNYISHTVMEHTSIIKFIKWNWLSGETGQLNTRDKNVNGIGDLIDPEAAGIFVP
jgi:phospholipase C